MNLEGSADMSSGVRMKRATTFSYLEIGRQRLESILKLYKKAQRRVNSQGVGSRALLTINRAAERGVTYNIS